MEIHLAPSLVLSREHPEASIGVPILLKLDGEEGPEVYSPEDLLELDGEPHEAAYHVRRLGRMLTGEQRAAVVAYLRQWPAGPQLDTPQDAD
jgi:hypothetical protein